MAVENMTFFTHPNKWIRGDRAPRTVAFNHVVGMALGETELWEKGRFQPSELSYNPADTEIREFMVEGHMARRMMNYFGRNRVEPFTQKDTQNCHSFAGWIRGDIALEYWSSADAYQLKSYAEPISHKYAYDTHTPSGSHVVVAAHERDEAPIGLVVAHSAIELGGELLAVMGINGPLALDTPETTLQHYNDRYCASSLYIPPGDGLLGTHIP
ncbi:MAG TPA: hypothetical protein VK694_06065 [Verrucomicrobiae bacterium]|nr:hypothetical protein [Verrucomicrobiae bacterium]